MGRKPMPLTPLLFILLFFSSCTVVGGIFKAGVWTGIIVIVIILIIIIWLVSKVNKK